MNEKNFDINNYDVSEYNMDVTIQSNLPVINPADSDESNIPEQSVKKRKEQSEEDLFEIVNDLLDQLEKGNEKYQAFSEEHSFFELYKDLIAICAKMDGADFTIICQRLKQKKSKYDISITDFKKDVARLIKEDNEREENKQKEEMAMASAAAAEESAVDIDPAADDIIVFADENMMPRQPSVIYNDVLSKMSKRNEDRDKPIFYNKTPCVLDGHKLDQIKEATFGTVIANMFKFYGLNGNSLSPFSKIPDHVIKMCFHNENFTNYFPEVNRVTSAPLFRNNGMIQSNSGYVSDLKIYQLPGADIKLFDSLELAVETLKKPFKDYLFVNEDSRGNMWAFFFSTLLQPFIDGNIPFFCFTSPTPGTGKGLLCKSLYKIIEGREPDKLIWPEKSNNSDAALKRTISSALLGGAPVNLFDNVPRHTLIDNNLLNIIATEDSVNVTVLYESAEKKAEVNSIFAFSGNNIGVSEDLSRRTQIIMLDTDCEKPQLKRFDIDLENYVIEHRSELLSAAISILHFWHKDGRKKCDQVKGSFDEWTQIIGGIIEFAELGEFKADSEANCRFDPFKLFIAKVYSEKSDEKWKASEVADIAIGTDDDGPLYNEVPDNIRSVNRFLGNLINGNINRIYQIFDEESKSLVSVRLIRSGKSIAKYSLKKL